MAAAAFPQGRLERDIPLGEPSPRACARARTIQIHIDYECTGNDVATSGSVVQNGENKNRLLREADVGDTATRSTRLDATTSVVASTPLIDLSLATPL